MARAHYRIALSDALEAHEDAIRFGGRRGISSLDLIESAIARPYSGYHRPIARKAAALLHGVISNHGFVDGNKRTALVLTTLLIDRSGYELVLREEDRFDDLIVDVARGAIEIEEIVVWFRERLVLN